MQVSPPPLEICYQDLMNKTNSLLKEMEQVIPHTIRCEWPPPNRGFPTLQPPDPQIPNKGLHLIDVAVKFQATNTCSIPNGCIMNSRNVKQSTAKNCSNGSFLPWLTPWLQCHFTHAAITFGTKSKGERSHMMVEKTNCPTKWWQNTMQISMI